MSKYILITTTFDDAEIANKVIQTLLANRFVSCCQLSEIKSSYHWKGKIESSNEFLLQMKTKKSLYKEVEKKILEMHNYETPQIVAYDITDGFKDYLDWIEEECTNE